MKKNKKIVILSIGIIVAFLLGYTTKTEAASLYTINGKVFQDVNQNGKMDLEKFEIGLKNQKVTLFQDMNDAQNGNNPIKTSTTNFAGDYNFSLLKKGTYYVKYNENNDQYSTHESPDNLVDSEGKQISNIYPVTVNAGKFITKRDLPLIKKVSMSVTPFNDVNFNGVKEADEEILNGKTVLILNLKQFSKAIQEGVLNNIDISNIVGSALSDGNVDLADGVHLRTVRKDQAIRMDSLETGAYVIVRSPFDLNVGDILNNRKRLEAIVEILINGNIQGLLDHPELFGTGDIDTNRDNRGLYFFADTLAKIAALSNNVDYDSVLEENQSKKMTQTINQLQSISDILNSLPAYKLGVVNYYGDMFDITGFKLKKTNDFYFGIKNFATLSGIAFSDTNNDGNLNSLELSGFTSTILAYDENGTILNQSNTSGSSRNYKLDRLPFDTDIYLAVETDRPVYPLLDDNDVPEALKGKKIISKNTISKYDRNTIIDQNIAGMGSSSSAVSVAFESIDPETKTATLQFKNTDKSNKVTVFYSLNDEEQSSLTLNKAPIFGSSKPVKQNVANVLINEENILKTYFNSGVYKVYLPDLIF